MKRTHTCGDLTKEDIGQFVCLQGWVQSPRDHGGIIFIDLRDRYGLTQVVFNPEDTTLFEQAESLRREWVIEVHGEIVSRKEGMINPNMPTGEVEVEIKELRILNKSEVPPIEIDDRKTSTDEIRMKYRYLDLRIPQNQNKIILRHNVALAIRKFLSEKKFIEVETPLLVRSTPEGARDYIVPSRVNPGRFYALPQSPQLYKQLLMVSGMDRYFQLPRCLRDEDLRSDRQPEHTQIDIEMSFPELKDLWTLGEGVAKTAFKEALNMDIETPFPRINYSDSIDKYGIDKPDIRFELFLTDITDIAKESDFGVFKTVIESGGVVKCVNPVQEFSRNQIDDYLEFAQKQGAKGMIWMRVTENGLEGNISKFFNEDLQKKLIERINAKPGSVIFAVADSVKKTNYVMARVRLKLGEDLKLYDPGEFKFCWIQNFPLFDWNEDDERWEPAHHMFCMPFEEHLHFLETDPGKIHCTQFDMVLNGVELASGSIRIHNPDIQARIMKVIGLSQEQLEEKFGFLLEAFRYGAPPHGGFAIGFDRLVALMCGTNDIREVIAFPKNKNAQCTMDGSPGTVGDLQLKENNIKLNVINKDKKEEK
ncbi:aspartate--tRNA ligase [Candidatus Woesearchaeota archaeon]|jgi:aspartyl-tRNA synthetase|nr:aspartate--tRNA ligase [Candidatus Woesearchaeota archaeon]